MIVGVANARREAVVPLRVRGSNGAELAIEAVIDTGFSGYLTLPAAAVAGLGLPHHSVGGAVLPDGTVRQFAIYEAEVIWGESWRKVLVSSVGTEMLAGMRLLARHELRIAVVANGAAEIVPLR